MTTEALHPTVHIKEFALHKPMNRVGQPIVVSAVLVIDSDQATQTQVRLTLPGGIGIVDGNENVTLNIERETTLTWMLQAHDAKACSFELEAATSDGVDKASILLCILPAMQSERLDYIPVPQPAKSRVLIGAHHCPLWAADRPSMWDNVIKHPERTPALGFYNQENPEINDWETIWAVEHGIDFFVYCWYRTSQGGPVTTQFAEAIHDGLFKSRYVDKIKFTIMWENQNRGKAGISDEQDLMENLLPYWIENYFKHPSYLKVDGKPVLYVYRPEFLIDDLGSIENAARGIELMRKACRDAGFDGLYVLGEYRGTDPAHLSLLKQLGLDYTFAYCWHVADNPTPQEAIEAQMESMHKIQELGIIRQTPTVSQAWSGWRDEGSIWKIPPADFETLLQKASDFMATLPPDELGSRILLLDNWNEWGEGHYIAPYQEYGFGYLDAVRKVFTDAPDAHRDLVPEDIGMGPYDTAIRALLAKPAT